MTGPLTATIASTSTPNSWGRQITFPGDTRAGACSHDKTVNAGDLKCSFATLVIVLDSTLVGNTWSGDVVQSGVSTGTFRSTRQA